jgi:hypothetical protein
MAYTLGDAARATGKSKPTIAKAIKVGRISAARAEDGSYQIDPAELHRVYPVAGKSDSNLLHDETPPVDGSLLGEIEKWRALATEREETIRDLRARLDAEAAERRRLTALLTDQRGSLIAKDQHYRPPWWRRWFR